jgi:oligoribonuclease
MKLLWIDLETAGLDPAQHGILEIAALVADLQRPFEPDGDPFVAVLRWAEPAAISAPAREMHTRSGLLAESARSTQGVEDAERSLLQLVPEVTPATDSSDRTTVAGSSAHFDLGFVRKCMPTLARRLSHRVYDVSAVELFCRSFGMPKLPRAEAHRALADIRESLTNARACAEWLRLRHPPISASPPLSR